MGRERMRKLLVCLACFIVVGCATTYGTPGFTGGYRDQYIGEDVYRVYFGANGFATRETAQT